MTEHRLNPNTIYYTVVYCVYLLLAAVSILISKLGFFDKYMSDIA